MLLVLSVGLASAHITHTRRALVVQGSGSGGVTDTRLQAQGCTHMPASRGSPPTPLELLQSTPRALHMLLVLSVGWPVRALYARARRALVVKGSGSGGLTDTRLQAQLDSHACKQGQCPHPS